MQEDNKFLGGFVGSILVHVALIILFFVIPTPKPPEAPLTFEVLEKPHSNNKRDEQQVIRSANVPDKMLSETDDDRLRFLADKTQRVKEQMRAMRSGLTKNRSQEASQESQQNPRQNQAKKEPVTKDQSKQAQNEVQTEKELDTTGFEKFLPNKIAIPTARQQQRNDQERGFSTLAEDLPSDIQAGEITAVDTDHYLFYSYFSRAQELLWNEWAPMVQSILNRPPPSIKASVQNRFTTVLEAWFLPSGQLQSVHLLKPSGVPELDYAASASFKRVGMIPNPPREKIDPDGLIRFKWSLTVQYDPKVLVRQ